jgi:hypothetical protein
VVLDAEVGFLSNTPLEAIKGDDYKLHHDSDGYPELRACLDPQALLEKSGVIVESLMRITRHEFDQGARNAVIPPFACVVGAPLRD